MSNESRDLRQRATRYRDHLKAELAKVEEFLAMADYVDKVTETMGPVIPANGEAQPDEAPLNLFDKVN